MKKKINILKLANEHVRNLFKQNKSEKLVYHNYKHTDDVVKSAKSISKECGLTKRETELLLLAAWFHDTGYLTKYDGHEEISVNYATEFLSKYNFTEEDKNIIASAIRATRFPQTPKTLLEEVLCDADLSHLSKKGYMKRFKLLRLEWELFNRSPKVENWRQSNMEFFCQHQYHTEYALVIFARGKAKNYFKLKTKLKEQNKIEEKIPLEVEAVE